MILGIDIGNSNIAMALINKQRVTKKACYETNREIQYEEYLRKIINDSKITEIIISSVVPKINETMKQAVINICGKEPIFVNSELNLGITIKYDNPQKLGADLISVAVGAIAKYESPVIIIDIGTATTFSVINRNKEYLGGMIAPGPHTSVKALATMTAQLPKIELVATNKVIGTNTIDCMKIGIMTAHAAMIDGMIEKVLAELNENNVKIIATGGGAKNIIDMCTHTIIWDEDIIFDGLYEICKRNK